MAHGFDSNYIPEDLVREIFLRSPVKSLIRFQSLSKEHAAMFKTPTFISEHLHHSHNKPSLLCTTKMRHRCHVHLIQNHEMNEQKVMVWLLQSKLPIYRVIGCSNGLICMFIGDQFKPSGLSIWNPATKEIIEIKLTRQKFEELIQCGLGFGFSVIANDYKIVILHSEDKRAVYSMSTRKWRRIKTQSFRPTFFSEPVISTDRALFWLGYEITENIKFILRLTSFDLDNEVFTMINSPPGIEQVYKGYIQVALYKDSLALLHNNCNLVHIWVKDQKSETGDCFTWVKLFTIESFPILPSRSFASWEREIVIHKMNKGTTYGKVLTFCNPHNNEIRDLSFNIFGEDLMFFRYIESLVSVNG